MLIFVSSGIPGITPYSSGPHIWGKCLSLFDNPLALPLDGETVDAMVNGLINRIKEPCHLIGHDLGGLVALTAAAEIPERVRSVSVVAAVAAAPSGDGVPNVTFAHPPRPLWSRESQRWALERISYSHQHIDEHLLNACVQASSQRVPADKDAFLSSQMAAKFKLYALCREGGYPVPAQVVWGTHDPLGSFEHGLWLFRLLAAKQKAVQFHAMNRVGALPFREDPEGFYQIISSFVEST